MVNCWYACWMTFHHCFHSLSYFVLLNVFTVWILKEDIFSRERSVFDRWRNNVKLLKRSSEVERSLLGRWVVGSILHGVDPLSYFSFQPVLHDWCNKGRGVCYPVCGMVHIKVPLLLIDKSSLCGGSGYPFSLSE